MKVVEVSKSTWERLLRENNTQCQKCKRFGAELGLANLVPVKTDENIKLLCVACTESLNERIEWHIDMEGEQERDSSPVLGASSALAGLGLLGRFLKFCWRRFLRMNLK